MTELLPVYTSVLSLSITDDPIWKVGVFATRTLTTDTNYVELRTTVQDTN